MSTQHTPGPWRVDPHDLYIFGPNSAMIFQMNDGEGDMPADAIGVVRGYGGGLPQEANAALIAASPDLLAALEALASQLDAIVDDDSYRGVFTFANVHGLVYRGPTWVRQLEAARHAIAKATVAPAPAAPGEGV